MGLLCIALTKVMRAAGEPFAYMMPHSWHLACVLLHFSDVELDLPPGELSSLALMGTAVLLMTMPGNEWSVRIMAAVP